VSGDRRGTGHLIGVFVILGLALTTVVGCGSSATGHAVIAVSPATAVLDVPVSVRLTGLRADAAVTVAATANDDRGVVWTSSAAFQSDAAGQLSLDQAPLSGSYTGRNPMGLFQFMLPPASAPLDDTTLLIPRSGDLVVRLTASIAGKQVASATVHRQSPRAAGVTERSYRPAGTGIYATLYEPAKLTGRRPAVLAFGGSEGGESQDLAAELLASHGYPAMSLAYFAEPGLPATLTDIPLDYFVKALAVLRAAPGVDPAHVLVSGVSRGGEAALLLGAHFPNLVNGVFAGVPSSVANPGLPDTSKPAWLLAGRPLAFAPLADVGEPAPANAPQSIIQVERIRGPILIDCGTSDTEWNSCGYLDAITSRLQAQHFRYPVTALKLDGGHLVAGLYRYYSATDTRFVELGGSAASDERAEAQVYATALTLLGSLARH
jgi:dienelactone hydrolase